MSVQSNTISPNTPVTPKHRSRQSIVAKYTFLAVWILIVGLLVCEFLGWPFLRLPLQNFMSKSLERPVIISQPFDLKLLGELKLSVDGLYIAAPETFNLPHFVNTSKVTLHLRYRDLIDFKNTNALRIKALQVTKINAQLLRKKNGDATWQFNADKDKPDSPLPIIETLLVKDGVAKIVDPHSKVDLNTQFKTEEGNNNQSPSSTIAFQGKLNSKPIKGQLSTEGFLPIATDNQDAPPIPAKAWVDYANIRADFNGSVSDLFGHQNVKGQLSVKGASLAILGELVNVVLPTTGKFTLRTALNKDNQVWIANQTVAHIGDSDLSGNFRFDPRPERPLLTGNLMGKRLLMRDLSPSFGSKNSDGSNATPQQNHLIPDRPLDLPSLNNMDANIKINLQHVDLGEAFSRPIAPLKANLVLESGKLSLSDIDARTADGAIAGLLSIDTHATKGDVKKPAPTWHINLKWKDIDVEKWLTFTTKPKEEAQAKGEKKNPPSYLAGTLNGKTNLTGRGNSTAQMLSSLNGDVAIFMQKGTISRLVIEALGLDIAQTLGIILTKDKELPMQCAVVNLQAKNGVATPSLALVDTPLTLILMDGSINIAQEILDLRLLAKPKNSSPLTVRSPIHIDGTFKDPSIYIEKTPIAMRLLGSIALTFINPLAAILPFLDIGSGEPSPCNESLATFNKVR